MTDWKTYKLGDIAEIVGGGTPSTKVDRFWNGDIPWLTPKDLTNYSNRYIVRGERNINKEGLNNSSSKLVPKGTVLLTSRAPIGYLAIADTVLCTNQGFKSFIVNEQKVDNLFLFYLLKNNVDYLKSLGTGTTFGEVSATTLRNIEFNFRSLQVQKQIALILSSLDNKIELILQMNQTLEATAQAIFKEWFVKFNFPGFDGKLVDGLPKGWRKGKVGEEFRLIMGQSPPGETYNENGDGTVFYQGRTDYGFRFPQNRMFTTSPNRLAEKLDTLVCVRAPVGDINMANEKCCIGRGLASIRHNSGAYSYTFYFMKNIENIFKGFESEGTVFGSINKANFENIEIIVPDANLIYEFEKVSNPIDEKILVLSREITSLTQIRDSLLPKLMSGKIEVKESLNLK